MIDSKSTIERIVKDAELARFPRALEYLKIYYGDRRERRAFIKDWQTNVSAGIAATVTDTFIAHLFDSSDSFEIAGLNSEDQDKIEATKIGLIWAFQTSDAKRIIRQAYRDAVPLGEGFTKVFRDNIGEGTIEYVDKKNNKVVKVPSKKTGRPGIKYVSYFNMFKDRSSSDFYKGRYRSERMIMPIDSIGGYLKAFGVSFTEKERRDIINSAEYFTSKEWDLERINIATKGSQNLNTSSGGDGNSTDYSFDENIYVEVIYVELGEKIKIFVNGEEKFNGKNPLPRRATSYQQFSYRDIPGTSDALGVISEAEDFDILASSMLNAFMDHIKLRVPAPMGKVVGTSQLENISGQDELSPGEFIEVTSPSDIFTLNMGDLKLEIVSIVNFLYSLAFQRSGVNEYATGTGKSRGVDRSAAATNETVNGFRARTIPFQESYKKAMSMIGKHFIIMMKAFMTGEQTLQIFDTDKKQFNFEKINMDDILLDFTVIFNSSAMASALKEAQMQLKVQLLNVVGGLLIDPTTGLKRGDVTSLLKEVAVDMGLSNDFILTIDESLEMYKQEMEGKTSIDMGIQKSIQADQVADQKEQLGQGQEAQSIDQITKELQSQPQNREIVREDATVNEALTPPTFTS